MIIRFGKLHAFSVYYFVKIMPLIFQNSNFPRQRSFEAIDCFASLSVKGGGRSHGNLGKFSGKRRRVPIPKLFLAILQKKRETVE